MTFVVNDLGFVTRDRFSGGARSDFILGRADEDVQQFGRSDAIHQLDSRRLQPCIEGRLRQRLACGNAFAQRGNVMLGKFCEHGAVGRRRGEAHACPVMFDRGWQLIWPGLFEHDKGRPDMHRKQHAAETESECQRSRTNEAIVPSRPQHVASVTVTDRKHVTVKMHGALGLAGSPRRKSDQADIVGGRIDSCKLRACV